MKSALYNGIKFIDIDRTTDFGTDRIPNKGNVMCFESIIGNNTTYYHYVVLYVMDYRSSYGKSFEKGQIDSTSIYIILKRIYPELADKTFQSIADILQKNF